MTPEEACEFTADPMHQLYVLMRQWDERAKVCVYVCVYVCLSVCLCLCVCICLNFRMFLFEQVVDKPVPPLESYLALVDSLTANTVPPLPDVYILSAPQLQFWQTHGFLKIPNLLSFHGVCDNTTIPTTMYHYSVAC